MFRKKIKTSHLSASHANVIFFFFLPLPIFIRLCLDSSEVKCSTHCWGIGAGDPECSNAEFISL